MFSHLIDPPPASQSDAAGRFVELLRGACADASLVRLVLSGHGGEEEGLERLLVRPVELRGRTQLSFLWRYRTRDVTKNHPLPQAVETIADLLDGRFRHALLQTRTREIQLGYGRRGQPVLRVGKLKAAVPSAPAGAPLPDPAPAGALLPEPVAAGAPRPEAAAASPAAHDRAKQRWLSPDAAFWTDLGLTHEVKGARQVVPAMSRKWKQINRFLEVMSAALKGSPLADGDRLRVADFGSGKGYLAFAMHAWLHAQGRQAQVTGVELREELVALCDAVAARHGLDGLRFRQGDVRAYEPGPLDVMIALHACDTATDHAIHLGLRAGAAIIMCSPCCHREIRPQMRTPPLLRPLLQHGIHLGQEAEMVTDSLRAALLEAEGYETQVFEFVALEHTSKNKMILAVRRSGEALAAALRRRPEVLAQIDEVKRFYGIREQCLEGLVRRGRGRRGLADADLMPRKPAPPVGAHDGVTVFGSAEDPTP